MSDQRTHFVNNAIRILAEEFSVIHRTSTAYYPQGNGQAEATNKILGTIPTKIIADNRRNWHTKLNSALWAYRTTFKTHLHFSPYFLAYGIRPRLPFGEVEIQEAAEEEVRHERLRELIQLEMEREEAEYRIEGYQERQKQWHQAKRPEQTIVQGEQVLWYPGSILAMGSKFKKRWEGPYIAKEVYSNGTAKLTTLEGELVAKRVNWNKLKTYFPKRTLEVNTITIVTQETIGKIRSVCISKDFEIATMV